MPPLVPPGASPLVPPFKVAFSNYLQFSLYPPAKVPYQILLKILYFPRRSYLLPDDITIIYLLRRHHSQTIKNVTCDIGTEILNFQCFCTIENHIFFKSIIFRGIGTIFRALSFGTIKTRFKAFWEYLFDPSISIVYPPNMTRGVVIQ